MAELHRTDAVPLALLIRQLGFNARQIEAGFYETAQGETPFRAQALAEAYARSRPEDFLVNQQAVLAALPSGGVPLGPMGDG